ncbi:hypothetical protein N7495_002486 [Penicillium taxi]|uniref:uncharacterized protein n=1 Tax=Penicillium taxi TaxID=168475 RepID=UPI0025455C01|nr:uncharacterized protein N7495_002486 [Penicillium taxi]KAJ5901958.1 hypothetical protein N7495_002486 [Penicillium taxi]
MKFFVTLSILALASVDVARCYVCNLSSGCLRTDIGDAIQTGFNQFVKFTKVKGGNGVNNCNEADA